MKHEMEAFPLVDRFQYRVPSDKRDRKRIRREIKVGVSVTWRALLSVCVRFVAGGHKTKQRRGSCNHVVISIGISLQ